MDQDETWHAGRPRPWPRWFRWGPSSPPPKRGADPQFSAYFYSGQTAGWIIIKMPLSTEVNLGPGDVVLDEIAAPQPAKMGHSFRRMSIVATVAHLSYC